MSAIKQTKNIEHYERDNRNQTLSKHGERW